MKAAVWWLRRDLRLTDNQALQAALESADQVVPLFILDPALHRSPYVGEKRLAFLYASLQALDSDLRRRGGRLIVRQGEPAAVLEQVLQESRAGAVFAEADVSPYARQRDQRAAQSLPLTLVGFPSVHPPGAVLKADGTPYTVFTPFSKAWKALPFPFVSETAAADAPISTPQTLSSLSIPQPPAGLPALPFPAGEAHAHARLQAFTTGLSAPVYAYGEARNNLDVEGTSGLSPYLRFGALSARRAASAAYTAMRSAPGEPARRSAETWLNELIWREFYIHILYHFPDARRRSFRAELRKIRWDNNPALFQAWCDGKTGYPVVDAAMRQLSQTGWMHNRARMIVASFLTKDLLIDWRWGERWFMQHLVDGDPASNNGGWQWTAGTGTDAAPYFRVFNPTRQGLEYDPHGATIRRWLPELAGVPTEYIHEPWTMPAAVQRQSGCLIGKDYPAPVVDHHQARERVLAVYGQAKQ
jgi:deoxyribodipyrimidine photo-lyase